MKSFLEVLAGSVVCAALFFTPLAASAADGELVNPYAGREDVVEEGGSLLNQYCSHCHGPWAVQGERPRDLRRLNLRYGDYAMSTYYTTVQEGYAFRLRSETLNQDAVPVFYSSSIG